MSRIVRIGLLLAGVGLGLGSAFAIGTARAGEGESEAEVVKVVVHVNFADAERQGGGLKNVANVLKASPKAQVEVVCHGPGIVLVEKARGGHGAEVADLIRQGVAFKACENTMKQRSIRKEDLLPGVGTVPVGTLEVIRKQQKDGFAYFKP